MTQKQHTSKTKHTTKKQTGGGGGDGTVMESLRTTNKDKQDTTKSPHLTLLLVVRCVFFLMCINVISFFVVHNVERAAEDSQAFCSQTARLYQKSIHNCGNLDTKPET